MPLYDIKCEAGHLTERFIKLEDFEAPIICACGTPAIRVISTPMFTVDQTGYSCPITDKWIGSKHAHRENLALHGCRVLEPGEKELSTASRAAADRAFERKLDETVEREWDLLPSDKREKIGAELTSGVDIAVTRQTAQT